MAVVMIVCPKMQLPVSTGIDPREEWLLPGYARVIKCPACGELHPWDKLEDWVVETPREYSH